MYVLTVHFLSQVLRSCNELFKAGYILSGIYRVDPLDGQGGFGVYCDQENGGGWTVILRRYDGFESFDRGWKAYAGGLGDLTGEFWAGLTKMRRITGDGNFTMRFDLESPDGEKKYAEYSGSKLGPLNTKFKITVGSYTGEKGGEGWNGRIMKQAILVTRGRAPFGQHQESRPLGPQRSNECACLIRARVGGNGLHHFHRNKQRQNGGRFKFYGMCFISRG